VSEIDSLRERVDAARRAYAALPLRGWGEPGPADERTGERWDRGNVLGHVAEMVPYWTGQARAVLDGAATMGRDGAGSEARRTAIDSAHDAGEAPLLGRIDAGLAELLALLAGMGEADLARPVTTRIAGDQRTWDLGRAIEALLVVHSEEHLEQLGEQGR
jgi:DinB superfamily